MKRNLLIAATLLSAGTAFAQSMPEGMVNLLPTGVTTDFTNGKKFMCEKNLTVAGSPEKGYKAFFSATDAEHGEELWVTDGTVEGTHMVKDINPGMKGSNVSYISRFNDKVVFSANDGENGAEPWISDGTAEGTYMLADIHEAESSNPVGFCQMSETQFVFFAMDYESEIYGTDGVAQKWLYVSDGTTDGTKLVAMVDCKFPGDDGDSRYGSVIRVGRRVFFKGDMADKDGITYGTELWITDGTTEGTYMVKDCNQSKNTTAVEGSTNQSNLNRFCNFYNEGLHFKPYTSTYGHEPWFSDGTEEGTYLIKDTNPTIKENGTGADGAPTMVGEVYKGLVCSRGYSPDYGTEFAYTNCEKGDYHVIDINVNEPTASNNSYADFGVVFDDLYIFCANSGTLKNTPGNYGGELHCFDGEKVWLQSDFAPGTQSNWVKEPLVVGGSLYWWNAADGGNGIDGTKATLTKLIRLDSYDGTPVIVSDIDPNGDNVYMLRNLNGDVLFTSSVTKTLYRYHYRQPGYDPTKNPDVMEPEYRTRAEIAMGVTEVPAREAIELQVFPNPATEQIRFKGIEEVNCDIRVYDVNGRLVINREGAHSTSRINVASLEPGNYEVVVSYDGKSRSASFIVK
jgi:ELWxxDGT repeat protein